MERIDLINLALLWCITGVAFICAINARGIFKTLLTWIILSAILVTTVFFTYLKSVSVRDDLNLNERPTQTLQDSTKSESLQNYNALYLKSTERLINDALQCVAAIHSFPAWDVISSQNPNGLEKFESKALSLRNKSMDIYRQIRTLEPPDSERASYELLLAAAENLRLAGYEIHHQFGAEPNTQTDGLNKAIKYATQAETVFSQLKESL